VELAVLCRLNISHDRVFLSTRISFFAFRGRDHLCAASAMFFAEMIGRRSRRNSLPQPDVVPSSRATSGTRRLTAWTLDQRRGDDVAAHDAAEDV